MDKREIEDAILARIADERPKPETAPDLGVFLGRLADTSDAAGRFVTQIDQWIARAQAAEAQLTALRASLEPVVEAVEKATAGEWEHETVENEGAYGIGDDTRDGFQSAAIIDDQGRVLFDALNTTAAMVHEEYDEDGGYAWDETSRLNARAIVASINWLRGPARDFIRGERG